MGFDVITFGAAVRDIFLFVDSADAMVLDNPKGEMTRKKLIAFEYGAKINAVRSVHTLGGGALNSAVTFSRMGFTSASAVSLGDDDDATAVEHRLKDEKVSTSLVMRNMKEKTGFSVLTVAGDAHDHVAIVERGANESYQYQPKRSITSASWFYTTSFSGPHWKKAIDAISKTAHERNIKWAWNPGSAQLEKGLTGLSAYLKRCTVLLLNRDEALGLVSANGKKKVKDKPTYLLDALLAHGSDIVLITDGKQGVYCADATQKIFMSADKSIKARESTGAGDSFGSGFVSGLMMGTMTDMGFALDVGMTNAESVICKVGAQEGILKRSDILSLKRTPKHTIKKVR